MITRAYALTDFNLRLFIKKYESESPLNRGDYVLARCHDGLRLLIVKSRGIDSDGGESHHLPIEKVIEPRPGQLIETNYGFVRDLTVRRKELPEEPVQFFPRECAFAFWLKNKEDSLEFTYSAARACEVMRRRFTAGFWDKAEKL